MVMLNMQKVTPNHLSVTLEEILCLAGLGILSCRVEGRYWIACQE